MKLRAERHTRGALAAAATMIAIALTGCGTQSPAAGPSVSATQPSATFVGPNGEKASPLSSLTLSNDEIATIKAKNYTAAFVWHTSGDFVAAVERGARAEFDTLGIKVVTTTQADFDAGKQANNIQAVAALKPSIVIATAVDATSAATAFKPILDAGSKLVIMTTPPQGYKQRTDYTTIVTEDLALAGRDNAEILGDALSKKGEIGVLYHSANFWFTNQRDKSFQDWMAYEYPGIQVVDKAGFTDEKATQDIAAAMIAKHPNLKGIYVAWGTAAQGVIAAIKASGRTDIKVVTNDLDTTVATAMMQGNLVAGMVGNGSVGIGTGLAIGGAYGVLGKSAPPLVASTPTKVTKANLVTAWQSDYGQSPPASVTSGS